MVAKKPRLRKVATMREKVETAKEKAERSSDSSKLAKTGAKLPKPGILAPITKALAVVLWPFKKLLSLLAPKYVINSWREVRQVTWPSRSETWRLTGAVFVFAIVFGALVAGVDKILDILFKEFILK